MGSNLSRELLFVQRLLFLEREMSLRAYPPLSAT